MVRGVHLKAQVQLEGGLACGQRWLKGGRGGGGALLGLTVQLLLQWLVQNNPFL